MEKSAENVMQEGVKAKFGQSQLHRNYVLSTWDKVLAEVSLRDIHWSCGLAAKDITQIIDTANWPGKKWLVLIIMEVGESLKPQQ